MTRPDLAEQPGNLPEAEIARGLVPDRQDHVPSLDPRSRRRATWIHRRATVSPRLLMRTTPLWSKTQGSPNPFAFSRYSRRCGMSNVATWRRKDLQPNQAIPSRPGETEDRPLVPMFSDREGFDRGVFGRMEARDVLADPL